MTATNHAMTGAAIGLLLGEPLLAVPAAVISHYFCDTFPHYTSAMPSEKLLKTTGFRNYLVLEAFLCGLLVVMLAVIRPEHWLLAAFCAFAAAAPDFLWLPRYIKTLRGQQWRPNLYSRLALRIQWFIKPIGAWVELAWFIAMAAIILPFLRAA